MENTQIKQKFPAGMILVLIFIGVGILETLYGVFTGAPAQLGPVLATGIGAVIIYLVLTAIVGTIFYGIINRLKWARKLAIVWYILAMVLTPINMAFSIFTNEAANDAYQKILSAGSVGITIMLGTLIGALAIQLVILIYIARKKDFFVK